jgi:thiosulfate reductase cytochrome b subunit
VKRHSLSTRAWHWINTVSVIVLFMSGLTISNAHPRLYWGEWGFAPEQAWLHVWRFPDWATIPGYYSLAAARDWHILFAWIFAVGLLLFVTAALFNGHLRRDIVPRRQEWRIEAVRADIRDHLRLRFDRTRGYNFLQKLGYALVLFLLLPLLIVTGLAMSPGMDAAWPFLTQMFGGRQSARSLHFIAAWAVFAFFVAHVLLVLLSGPLRQLRDMITGGKRDEAA